MIKARLEVSPLKIAKRCKIWSEFEKKCKICAQCVESGEKKFKRRKIFFHGISGETKFFTATSRMRWKKNFTATSKKLWKKISQLKSKILQIFTAKFNAYLKFTGNIIDVSDRWRSGIRSWWHAVGEWFEPLYGSFFFGRNPVNAVKKISTLNSTQISQKFTAFIAFNAKRWGRFAVKKNFFSPLFTTNFTLFLIKPRPGSLKHDKMKPDQ